MAYAEDDGGDHVDAEYSVGQDGDLLALVLESASGASKDRPARNPDYRRALEMLLARLRELDAVLEDALVDSGYTQRIGLSEGERRLIEDRPVRLSAQPSMTELRKTLTRNQAHIGQRAGVSRDGNTTKRIQLLLRVPGFEPSEAGRLEKVLSSVVGQFEYRSADEAEADAGLTFPEGAVTRVEVNKYERDPAARKACLAKYGYKCSVCDLDFEAEYGGIGKGFIHVHHLRELSTVGAGYKVDPIEDLRPVCPNCHAMLHKRRPAFTPEELRRMLRRPPARAIS